MAQLSNEKIEIDGKEYTLFLNRKGLLSWEKITQLSKTAEKLSDKYKGITEEIEKKDTPIEVKDGDNPFDVLSESFDGSIDEDEEKLRDIYVKFYWIVLYENHKLSISEVRILFDKAEEEYGLEQLMALANQMIEDINKNKYGKTPVKKLKALRPTT